MAEPLRTCVGCRVRAAQASLVRLAWDETSAVVVVDRPRRVPGRGAYLHPECVARAVKSRAIGRALRRPVDPIAMRSALAELQP